MKYALFTIAQDELDLLPLWAAHYKAYAPDAALFVLDHDSVGDAARYMFQLRAQGVEVIPVHHSRSFDYNWLTRVVEHFMAFLLHSFAAVVFSEADELLLPTPGTYGHLGELLDDKLASEPFLRATGRCVVHHYLEEPGVNWSQPWLAQRKHWYRSDRYSKICATKYPIYYTAGFHKAENVPESLEPLPELLCLHLHQADYQTTLRRHQRNAARFWAPEWRLSPEGIHQRLDNPADLQRYLLCNLDAPETYATLEDIPSAYKEQYRVCRPD